MKKLKRIANILCLSGKRYVSDQLAQQAVALTYYTLFSIVPLAAMLFGIAKGFSLEEQLQDVIYSRFATHKDLVDWVCQFAETTLRQASGGIVAGVGVIALLWTVIWLITNIEKAFNAVWGLPMRRNWWRKFSDYISLMLLTPIFMVLVSTFGVMIRSKLNALGDALPGFSAGAKMADLAAGIAPVIINCLLLTVIYLFVPNTKVRLKGAIFAGIIAGIAFQLLQDGFLFLQKSVFAYNRIYGSFAALPLFLVWLNWSWQIVLFGAEISFVWQHVDSGVLGGDEQSRKMSLRLRREHQLAILRMVFLEFNRGNGGMDEYEISKALKLPENIMRIELQELLDLGVLCRAADVDNGSILLPGVPPEKFTVMDFLRLVNGVGDAETPDFARFEKIFSQMEQSVIASDKNMNIYKI